MNYDTLYNNKPEPGGEVPAAAPLPPLRIGDVTVDPPLLLAPMAGITDGAFRYLCRREGAGLTCTEMVSAKALTMGDGKSRSLLELLPDEHPAAAQIFGSDPACMAEAAAMALEISGADILDINMGCPVGKIVKGGDGSALMRDPELAGRIVEAVVSAVQKPVTVKMRKGWDSGSENAPELAKIVVQAGASAVTVHGRTRAQLYGGRADWDCIRAVKEALSVPVIANGDVMEPEDVLRILGRTGADGVMIGRGAFGNPWIFSRAKAVLSGRPAPPPPPLRERLEAALEQFTLEARRKGERVACLEARKHLAWYLRGVRYAATYKERAGTVSSLAEIRSLMDDVLSDNRGK